MPDSQVMTVHTEQHGPMTVVHLVGELDLATADAVRAPLRDAVDRHSPILVVDVTEVAFCGVAGLAALIECERQAHAVGTQVSVTGSRPELRRLMVLAGARDRFTLYRTPNDALAAASIPAPRFGTRLRPIVHTT